MESSLGGKTVWAEFLAAGAPAQALVRQACPGCGPATAQARSVEAVPVCGLANATASFVPPIYLAALTPGFEDVEWLVRSECRDAFQRDGEDFRELGGVAMDAVCAGVAKLGGRDAAREQRKRRDPRASGRSTVPYRVSDHRDW